jgi:hypothetical protein
MATGTRQLQKGDSTRPLANDAAQLSLIATRRKPNDFINLQTLLGIHILFATCAATSFHSGATTPGA